MVHKHKIIIAIASLLLCVSGCDSSSDRQRILDAVVEIERESQNVEPPAPLINLAPPSGWTGGETHPLPAADHGFTVPFEHESGLAVTLYQYTRGLSRIPNGVNSSPVKQEMNRAKKGIKQAVDLGYWQAAEETESKTVQLGDSPQQALWSQYQMKVDGMVLASDIYVWANNNTMFKIRCTGRSEDVQSNQAVLKPLLTSLGSP